MGDLGEVDAFGVRVSLNAINHESTPYAAPRFLSTLVEKVRLTDDGMPVVPRPVLVIADDWARFSSYLLSPGRTLPIVAVTKGADGKYLIDVWKLAERLSGLAQVYCLDPACCFALSDLVGKKLSVYGGAIRTYQAGFNKESHLFDHPLTMQKSIAEWSDDSGEGPDAFSTFLARQIFIGSIRDQARVSQLPSYFSIRKSFLDQPGKTAADDIALLRMEIEEAHNTIEEWRSIADDRDAEALALEDEIMSLRAQNQVLRHEVDRLRRDGTSPPESTPISYEEMAEWVDRNYSGKLFLHARAMRALKSARFEDVGLVYRALALLGDVYREMKMGDEDRSDLVERWENGLAELKLEYNSHALSATRLGEFRDVYTIPHRIGRQSKQVLGPHLKFGSSKDERYCMRIYFIWDEEREEVVIGHLPSHLETRAT